MELVFFTKIPFNNYIIKVLVINNHIITEEDIENENITFIISLNNEKEKKYIKINRKRKNYTNVKLDITFIELTNK